MLWIIAGFLILSALTVLSFLHLILKVWREEKGILKEMARKLAVKITLIFLVIFVPLLFLDSLYGTWIPTPELLGLLGGGLFWISTMVLFVLPFLNALKYRKSSTRTVKGVAYMLVATFLLVYAFFLPSALGVFETGNGLDMILIASYLIFLLSAIAIAFPYIVFRIPEGSWGDEKIERMLPGKRDYGITIGLIALSIVIMLVMGSTVAFIPEVYHNDIEDNMVKTKDFPDVARPEEIRLVPWSVAEAYLERVYGDAAAYLDTSGAVLAKNTHPTVVNGEFVWLNVPQFEPWKWLGGRKLPFYVMVNATGNNIEAKRVDVEMKVSTSNIEWDWRVSKIVRSVAGENYRIVEVRFDLDDNYHPYYIAYLAYEHPPFYYETLEKLVIIDAITGAAGVYSPSNAPKWLEVVYPDEYVYRWVNWWAQSRFGWYYATFVKTNLYHPDLPDAKFLLINGTSYWYIPLRQMQSHVLGGYVLVNTRTGKPIFYDRAEMNYVDYSTAWVQLHTYLSSGELGYMQLGIREGYLYAVNAGNGTVKEVYILPLYAGLTLQKIAIVDPVNYQNKPIIADDLESALDMLKSGSSGGNEIKEVIIGVEGMYISSTTAYVYNNSTIISIDKESLKYGNHTADEDWITLQIAYSRYLHGDDVVLILTMSGNVVIDVDLGM